MVESVFHRGQIPQSLATRFNGDLAVTLDAFSLESLSSNTPLPRSGMTLAWDGATNTANVQLTTEGHGVLPNGWYDGIWSDEALPLDAEHRTSFRFVLGDFDDDGAVSNQDIALFMDLLSGAATPPGVGPGGVFTTTPIEVIAVGDRVLARDQDDAGDDAELRRVAGVFVKTSGHVRHLTIQSADGRLERIETTDEHPFWRDGTGWTPAGELQAGDRIDLLAGNDGVVLASERVEHPGGVTVYNLEVEGDHTYFVADADTSFTNPVWVHNAGPCGGPAERFGSAADAIGDLAGSATLQKRTRTKHPQWQEWGYTETHYYRDSHGTKWTVFFSPKTGEYSGAHQSSGQEY